jgi:hypothetical protein
VLQTIQGFPTLEIYNDPQRKRALMLDYIMKRGQGDNSPLAVQDLLTDLAQRFLQESK